MSGLDWFIGHLPCNRRVAIALLDVLAVSGDSASRARALKAAGVAAPSIRSSTTWLPDRTLEDMFRAASVTPRLARRVGQSLVRAEGVGVFLCYSGLATVEKAYRRSHHLLARESQGARFEPPAIEGEKGVIRFTPTIAAGADDPAAPVMSVALAFCQMRIGMLEGLPMLFGLLPARVSETECAHKGADACTFEVSWTRSPKRGLVMGLALGALLASAAGAYLFSTGLGLAAAVATGTVVTALAGLAGRALDLSKQLEAVAGSRRGQLALLDQVDQSLAEKLDELAKLGAPSTSPSKTEHRGTRAEEMQGLVPVSRKRPALRGAGDTTTESHDQTIERAEAVRRAADDLREGMAQLIDDARGSEIESELRVRLAEARKLEALAAELERGARGTNRLRERHAPGKLVERALTSLQLERADAATIEKSLAADTPEVMCDGLQLEFMIEQLLRNALEASSEAASVRLELQSTAAGIELTVSDRGNGIEADALDEAFDPFFDEKVAGADGSFGLPVCYRIVAEHGGELRVETRPEEGTRVTVLLPPAPPHD
jgi:signal transduction histidine kinase